MKKLNINPKSPEKIYLRATTYQKKFEIEPYDLFHNRRLEDIIQLLSTLKKSEDEVISFEVVRESDDACYGCGGEYREKICYVKMVLETDEQFHARQELIQRKTEERRLRAKRLEERRLKIEEESAAAEREKDRVLYEKLKKRFEG
jgi:hypothetical protein